MRKKYVNIILDDLPIFEFDSSTNEIIKAKTLFINKKTYAYYDNFLEVLGDKKENKTQNYKQNFFV